MAQRRPKRGPKPKENALRRDPTRMSFAPGPVHGPMLDRLAAERTGGNKNALLRILLEEAEKRTKGDGSTRLVSGSRRGAVSRFRRTAAQGVRGLRAAA